jgi:hypothetical protein
MDRDRKEFWADDVPDIRMRRKALYVLRSGGDYLQGQVGVEKGSKVLYGWRPVGKDDAFGFASLASAAKAIPASVDAKHPMDSIQIEIRDSLILGDPIGFRDAKGNELRIGDFVRTDEGNWEGYVTDRDLVERCGPLGGFASGVDWSACELIRPYADLLTERK